MPFRTVTFSKSAGAASYSADQVAVEHAAIRFWENKSPKTFNLRRIYVTVAQVVRHAAASGVLWVSESNARNILQRCA